MPPTGDGDENAFDAFIGYEIPVNVKTPAAGEGRATEKAAAIFDLDTLGQDHEQQQHYELMEIHLSLYSLTGISYKAKLTKEKRRKWRRKSKGGTTPSAGSEGGSGGHAPGCTSTRAGTATLSTISESYAMNTVAGFDMNPLLPPTTAVVSCTRNDITSDRPMETFNPSLPLHRLSRGDRQHIRYSARWGTPRQSTRHDSIDVNSYPSFKILRMMGQQLYVPSTTIGEVSTYEHEQIDLCVFVGRGTEMIPIGVVSFVVTGDEETETILNLPVKKPAIGSDLYERHFQPGKRKKTVKDFFDNDPHHTFTLDHNTTLRIGVRALPQRSLVEAQELSGVARKDEQIFESVLHQIIDAELLTNIEEERSLIEDIVDGHRLQIQEDEQKKKTEVLCTDQIVLQDIPLPENYANMAGMENDTIWRRVQEVLQKEANETQENNIPKDTKTAPSPLPLIQPNFFCGFPFFQHSVPTTVPVSTTHPQTEKLESTVPQQVVTVHRPKPRVPLDSNNQTLGLTLVSSVSESVTTEGGHSNMKFRHEFADI
jgi:hypothetical protein